MIYKDLAIELINIATNPNISTSYDWYSSDTGRYGFDYKRNYTGRMANPYKAKARKKQGYFDFKIHAGPWNAINHYKFLGEILNKTTLDACEKVWKGESPLNITNNESEREILITLALLMFEQEVNWGDQSWQRDTNFKPDFSNPNFKRPRDMLMGFISVVFTNNSVDAIPHWKLNEAGSKSSPTFIHEFGQYEEWFKSHFLQYENNIDAEPLMISYVEKFQNVLDGTIDNPHHYPCGQCNNEISSYEKEYCERNFYKYNGNIYCRSHQ